VPSDELIKFGDSGPEFAFKGKLKPGKKLEGEIPYHCDRNPSSNLRVLKIGPKASVDMKAKNYDGYQDSECKHTELKTGMVEQCSRIRLVGYHVIGRVIASGCSTTCFATGLNINNQIRLD
jgi:hypothetical protein